MLYRHGIRRAVSSLARQLHALVRCAMPATGRPGGCFRIAKHLGQIRLDQYEVGSGDCLLVVLAANASLELRKIVLRTQIVIWSICGWLLHFVRGLRAGNVI